MLGIAVADRRERERERKIYRLPEESGITRKGGNGEGKAGGETDEGSNRGKEGHCRRETRSK